MIRLSERGILSRESRKLFSKKPYCEGGMGAFASVGFMESYGAFLSELKVLKLGITTKNIVLQLCYPACF